MREDDASYYRKRARQERERAATCEDNSVALAHLRMSDEYERRVQDLNVTLNVVADR